MTNSQGIVIIGGGHNGLVAAAYLARSGKKVTVLERLSEVGGAAISSWAFKGVEARLSRYSYLVSLLPKKIIRDLDLNLQLARRRYSSYTPLPGTDRGLLVDNGDSGATAESFNSIGAAKDAAVWDPFYESTRRLAATVFPSLCEPLMTRSELKKAVGDDRVWTQFLENPLGQVIESTFENDLVRGVVLTDGLIGTFAEANDPGLAANRCFLYHVIGNGTGDWDVPVGGMGAVTSAMAQSARNYGANLVTGAEVTSISPEGEVKYLKDGTEQTISGDAILANVSPTELQRLVTGERPKAPVEGAQVKVNLMLDRLPKLKDSALDPAAAFGGTFHINELYSQLQSAFERASGGSLPEPIPAEIYCHSLTDPSILSPELQASGAQTLTVFALHLPSRLVNSGNNEEMRSRLQDAVLDSLDSVLDEPIRSVLMKDADGELCVETKTTFDLEQGLRLPGGNIFHAPLDWPFLEDGEPLSTPAERWGVQTEWEKILICGSGARRGGAVSGIGGHNAAMAVLESE